MAQKIKLQELNRNQELLKQNPIFATKFKIIQELLLKPDLVELVINEPKQVVLLFASGKKEFKTIEKLSLQHLETLAQTLAQMQGTKFNENNPILSTKIIGGHRVQISAYTTVVSKFALSIRVNRYIDYDLKDFGVEAKLAKEIKQAIVDKKTILVSGGTGTGKTSLTNTLLKFVNVNERIISIEDVEELRLDHFKDKVQMIYYASNSSSTTVGADKLLRSSLRMNPDRILVGEIHTENAETFCSAINTGHEGSVGTIHANDPKGALSSVIMKVIMQGGNDSAIKVLQKQLCEDIYAVLQITKTDDGKRVATFAKVADFATDEALTNSIKKQIQKKDQ